MFFNRRDLREEKKFLSFFLVMLILLCERREPCLQWIFTRMFFVTEPICKGLISGGLSNSLKNRHSGRERRRPYMMQISLLSLSLFCRIHCFSQMNDWKLFQCDKTRKENNYTKFRWSPRRKATSDSEVAFIHSQDNGDTLTYSLPEKKGRHTKSVSLWKFLMLDALYRHHST